LTEFLLVLFVFFSIIALMSIGVLLRKKPIVGSCGGVGAALGESNYSCDICGGDSSKCESASSSQS